MGTQKNCLIETGFLSTQNTLKLMGKKIFTLKNVAYYIIFSQIDVMLHDFQKLNEVKNLVYKKDENQNIKFVPIQIHGTDKAL